ncbi:uncharacterized protein VP01_724g4 [Puccinia sorghi]|uniref:OTU domain-containing protein n=1 Tax=Puccinia sorghi TaxID=27349 RepID=A0A0L6UFA6_9BASI|nr:uncharacterized protein VP01_724g4 [Puccinia sorghi]
MKSFEERFSELKELLSKQPAVIEYLKNSILPEFKHLMCGIRPCFQQYIHFQLLWQPLIDSIKTLTNILSGFFRLQQKFCKHTILKAQNKLNILEKKDLTQPFSQTFYKSSGIPFSHMIGEILEECGPLEPEYFHPQLHLNYNPECLVSPHNPTRVQTLEVKEKTQGSPSLKKGASDSTKCLPSSHKLVKYQLGKDQKKFAAEKKKRKSESSKSCSRKKFKRKKEADYKDGNSGDTEEERDNGEQDSIDMEEKDKGDQKKVDMELETRNGIEENKKSLPEGSTDGKKEAFHVSQFASQIPEFSQKHFHKIFNLDGDGICGFRCMSVAIEYNEIGWFWVQLVKTIISHLKFSRIKNNLPPLRWLSKMYHGQAIANTFQRVVFPSVEESLSFFPTTTAVKDKNSKLDPIYFMHINRNHWVLALLKATGGSKPIPPCHFFYPFCFQNVAAASGEALGLRFRCGKASTTLEAFHCGLEPPLTPIVA